MADDSTHTPIQHMRIPQDDWDEMAAIYGRERSRVMRELVAWCLRKPSGKLPKRLTRAEIEERARLYRRRQSIRARVRRSPKRPAEEA